MATTPSFVAVGTLVATATNAATITPVPPNGSIGDFLLLVLERNDTTAAPTVTNWTNVAALTGTNTSSSTAVYWRIATSATGSVDQPSAITFGSSTVVRAGVVLRFAGVDNFNPVHQATLANVASTATTVNATNATSTRDNTLAVFIAVMIGARSSTNTTTNWNAGAGVTAFSSQQTTLGNDETIGFGVKTFDVAGSYLSPGIVWTTNTTTGVGQGLLVGLASIGSPPGQSTLDTIRPGVYLAKRFRFPVYDANACNNAILPELPDARAQVSWVQLEIPAAAPVVSLPPGQSTLDTKRPAAYFARAYRYPVYDANYGNSLIPELVSRDAMAAGQQSTALAPVPVALRLRDYSISEAFPLVLISQDAMVSGQQSVVLPPIATKRARDYTFAPPVSISVSTFVAVLPYGQQTTDNLSPRSATRLRDYTWVQSLVPNLVGQDATAAGNQSAALVPSPAPLRARDYSVTQSFPLSLIGQDAFAAGAQSVGLPPVAAARERDYTWVQDLIPNLISQDSMTVGSQSTALAPVPAALRAREYTIAEAFPLSLISQDAFNVGQQSTALPPIAAARARDYSWAPPISVNLATVVQVIPYGQQSTDNLPARAPSRARDYTWSQGLVPNLISQDSMATGQQSVALVPSPAPLRARDYSITRSFPLTLISQDALAVGAQSTLLPPIGPLRARDYTFAPPINLQTLGTVVQQIPYGAQVTDALAPKAAPRARDYTWIQELIPDLVGQDALNAGQQSTALAPQPVALRARDYTYDASFPLSLNGQDAFNAGQQSTALPPIGTLRARDYSFVPPINLPCLTTVVQQIPYGQQTTDSIPPKSAARLRDYTWLQDLIPDLVGQDQLTAGAQRFELAPVPAPLRAREYSISESFPLTLIGNDSMAAGAQRYDLAPIGALRARDYSFVPPINLSCLSTVVQPIPYGQQSTDNLAPRAVARAREYSIAEAFPLTLNGKDATTAGAQRTERPAYAAQRASQLSDPGTNFTLILNASQIPIGQLSTDLAPRAAARSRDYTFIWPVQTKLIGQDALPTGQNADREALPPKAAARARDYTWLQTYPLYVYEQLPIGDSTGLTEGPPKGPLRLRDYTHLDVTKQNLIGQDAMVTGQSWLSTDNLPPKAPARLRDYSLVVRFDLSGLAATTHPGMHTLTDRALFEHTLSDRALFEHTLTDRELYVHTLSDQVALQ